MVPYITIRDFFPSFFSRWFGKSAFLAIQQKRSSCRQKVPQIVGLISNVESEEMRKYTVLQFARSEWHIHKLLGLQHSLLHGEQIRIHRSESLGKSLHWCNLTRSRVFLYFPLIVALESQHLFPSVSDAVLLEGRFMKPNMINLVDSKAIQPCKFIWYLKFWSGIFADSICSQSDFSELDKFQFLSWKCWLFPILAFRALATGKTNNKSKQTI